MMPTRHPNPLKRLAFWIVRAEVGRLVDLLSQCETLNAETCRDLRRAATLKSAMERRLAERAVADRLIARLDGVFAGLVGVGGADSLDTQHGT